MTRAEVAAMIDHTSLAPQATGADIEALVTEAVELGVGAVCESPTMVGTASAVVSATRNGGPPLTVCSVVGFPSGAHRIEIKAAEARLAQADGATEIDMVVDLGSVKARDWDAVGADVAAVRAVVTGALKVVVEAAALDQSELEAVGRTAVAAGADFLKTSTGFHPAGGASVGAVLTLAAIAAESGRAVGVKASGGIRDTTTALAMIEAGATRLGCSASRAILDGLT